MLCNDAVEIGIFAHPLVFVFQVPASPKRVEYAYGVSQCKRKADPIRLNEIGVFFKHFFNMADGHGILPFQIYEKNAYFVFDFIFAHVVQREVQKHGAVLPTWKGHINALKIAEYKIYAIFRRIIYVLF